MVTHEAGGVSTRAPTAGRTFDVALYSCLTDTAAQVRRITWDELAEDLQGYDQREQKDGPLWSAVTLKPDTPSRANEHVERVHVAVFDVDHEEPHWRLLDGLEYAAHTTYKHHAGHPDCEGRQDCPHWRIAILLSRPIERRDWRGFWSRAKYWICPNADESCKDESRASYWPTCKPGADRDTRRGRGQALDPDSLRAVPDQHTAPARRAQPANGPADGDRPGDWLKTHVDWTEILEPHGWELTATLSDGSRRWKRPGKAERGHSATTGGGGHDVLYVFTSEAPPFQPNTSYTKLRAYSLLDHGGDDSKAASAINVRRYGEIHINDRLNGPPKNGTIGPTGDIAEVAQKPARFNRTDMGNAELLVSQHGADLGFCHPWNIWFAWDGRRWSKDLTGEARRRAKRSVRSMYTIAAGIEDEEERKALIKWAIQSEGAARVAAMLKGAEAETGIPILPEEMDADPYLFNVKNGTVDLRTGERLPHDRHHNITKLAPVEYDQVAECPTWSAFLERVIPDESVRRFIQRAAGYSLTGDTSEQCLFFLHGGGANGKSTFLTVLQAILGDYAKQAAPEMLTHRGGDRHPTELADLFGARLVTSVEVNEGKRLAEALVKQMTGGDRMKARFMRADFFEWTPTHKLFLAANHKPVIRGTDYAIWRRIHLVPFEVTIPKNERDPKLPGKLLAEASGILAWAIRGCLEWRREGLGVPKAVEDATAAYRAEQDVLADFLAERCVTDPQAWVASAALYRAYSGWCEGSSERPISKTAFGLRLTEKGFTQDKGAKGVRIWRGLRLLGPDEAPAGGAFEAGGALWRGFPDEREESPRETDNPENVPNAPPRRNAPPADGETRPCWSCHQQLSPTIDDPCSACGWLVCGRCGECEQGGACSGEVDSDDDERGDELP